MELDFTTFHWTTWLLAGASFALVASIWMAVLLMFQRRRAKEEMLMDDRLHLGHRDEFAGRKVLRLWHEGAEATTSVPILGERKSLAEKFQQQLQQAGITTRPSVVLEILLGVAMIFFVAIFVLTRSIWISLLGALIVWMLYQMHVHKKIYKQSGLLERQLMAAMDLAARSLRAGHPLVGAFRFIAEEIPNPVGGIFDEICRKQALGVPMEESVEKVAMESGSQDLKVFASSIMIQLRSGGNLADMMERLASVIRERVRLSRRFRVLTAQTQFSKRILLALPIFMFFVLHLMRPNYLLPLYESWTGRIMLVCSVVSLMLGTWVMNRIARLES